jgi:hypothetical protein
MVLDKDRFSGSSLLRSMPCHLVWSGNPKNAILTNSFRVVIKHCTFTPFFVPFLLYIDYHYRCS